jgi:PAS domain S-box-containing protein
MNAPRHDMHGAVKLIGVDSRLAQRLGDELSVRHAVEVLYDDGAFCRALAGGELQVDALVLGMALEEPVRTAQHMHAVDKHLPILILAAPGEFEQLRRTLMFSPFLGNEVSACACDDLEELVPTVCHAVERRRLRLQHQNTISMTQMQLEKLPLRQPEATHYLDQLLDYAPIGVVTINLCGIVLTLNRRALQTLGVSERALLGHAFVPCFPVTEQARVHAIVERACQGAGGRAPEVLEFHGAADEEPRFIELTAAPLSYRTGQRGAMAILQDVTQRVQAERERAHAEDELRRHATVLRGFHEISSDVTLTLPAKLRHLLYLGCEQFGLPIGILSHVDGTVLRVQNSVGADMQYPAGMTRSLGQTYCGATIQTSEPVAFEYAKTTRWCYHPGYGPPTMEAYIGMRVLVEGDVYGTLCFVSPAPRKLPFSSTDREVLKLMSQWVGSELQRQQAEAHMRKLSGALEQTADAVIITDRRRRIEYVNPSFERLTGYTKAEVVGQQANFMSSQLQDDKFHNQLWRVIGAGGVYRGTLVNRRKDGSLYHEQKTIAPIKGFQGEITHFISTGHDISDLLKAEEKERKHQAELAHVARLSTLGEMMSGLAHELNQPLCAMTTYAQTCLRILDGSHSETGRLRYGLEQVVRQAEVAGDIFRRLRSFARKDDFHPVYTNLRKLINEVIGLVRTEARQRFICLNIDMECDLPDVLVDAIQIEQVLLNLVRNSIDALAGVDGSRRILIRAVRQDTEWVRVSICDSGSGCPEDQVEHLFEPFFTTKPNGLGIGLRISQSIVEVHGGRLWLQENSPRGATFCFTLPINAEGAG